MDPVRPDDPTLPALLAQPAPEDGLAPGTRIGRYEIERRVGLGGMGVVYAARDPQLDRRVAVKLLRPDATFPDAETARRRLVAEAQALARLSHPNVVPVFDAGLLGEDVFITMELVEGVTLSAWLRAQPRRWREVLARFLSAGRGLCAAHEQGIVHRDFKPENVLVGRDGRVRVLDFGLAQRLSATDLAGLGGAPPERAPAGSVLAGTPRYMAPEQWRREPTSPATDQFSFAVALHEALFGERPFAGEQPLEIADAVTSGRLCPPPPRRGVPARLRRLLVPALASRPGDRYPSLAVLLDALGRDPRRNLRRFGLPVAAVAGLALALVGIRGRERTACQGADQALASVWDRPRAEAIHAAFTATGKPYAEGVFRGTTRALDEYTAAWAAMRVEACEATRLRGTQSEELLDLRMLCLSQRLTEVRAVVDLLERADAAAVEHAVNAVRGLEPLAACADVEALRRPLQLPRAPAERERVQALRARLSEAMALERLGRYADGLRVAREVVAGAEASAFPPLRAEALYWRGVLEHEAGEARAAEATLQEATIQAEAARHDELVARAWVQLVWVTGVSLARNADALARARYAQAAIDRLGPSAPEASAGGLAYVLGAVEGEAGRYDRAVAHLESALRGRERTYGAADPAVADALSNLGVALKAQGKHAEALARFRRAHAIRVQTLDPDHPTVAITLAAMGSVLRAQGALDQALEHHQRALAIRERALGPDHPDVGASLNSLGNVLTELGRHAEALSSYRRGLVIKRRAVGPDHPDVAVGENNVGESLRHLGKHAEAVAGYRRALAIWEKALGPGHPQVAIAVQNLGETRLAQGKSVQAVAHFERALGIWEKALGPSHPYLALPLLGLGEVALAGHRPAQALAPLERALRLREHGGGDAVAVAQARYALARALWDSGRDRERASILAGSALDAFARAGPARQADAARVRGWSGRHRRP